MLDSNLTLPISQLNANWDGLGDYLIASGLGEKILTLYQNDPQELIRPKFNDLFNAFALPLTEVKVVILGQDPYPSDHAHGLAFSSALDQQVPKSLVNIITTLKYDFGQDYQPNILGVANLSPWVSQGVFLLNTRLTVNKGEPLSKEHDIWDDFINQVFLRLAKVEHLVYLLWGKYAQGYSQRIEANNNCIIKTVHPSPLSAYRGFFSSQCFKQTNAYLESQGRTPIKW